jgi:hypothetical protein
MGDRCSAHGDRYKDKGERKKDKGERLEILEAGNLDSSR